MSCSPCIEQFAIRRNATPFTTSSTFCAFSLREAFLFEMARPLAGPLSSIGFEPDVIIECTGVGQLIVDSIRPWLLVVLCASRVSGAAGTP